MNVAKRKTYPYASRFFLALAALSLVVFGLIVATGAGAAQAQEANGKYDTDGDGLIEISNLEQLNAIRYDLDGNGTPLDVYVYKDRDGSFFDAGAYVSAFPVSTGEVVCASSCQGYELTRSLDFDDPDSYASGVVNTAWTTGEGWKPIAAWRPSWSAWDIPLYTIPFDATLNGNGYVIANVYANDRDFDSYGGLIYYIGENGAVLDVGLIDIDLSLNYGGGLVALNSGTITRCYVTGHLEGVPVDDPRVAGGIRRASFIGGLVGYNEGSISDSYATSDLSGEATDIGGLVGGNGRGSITNSYATGDVSGAHWRTGGLVGMNGNSYGAPASIRDSFASGDVTAIDGIIGGLAGQNIGGAAITASYSSGDVSLTGGIPIIGRLPGDWWD